MTETMARVSEKFDPESVKWRRITDPTCTKYKIDFEYSLLGYDLESGRLDLLARFAKGGGHCRRHRHVASTVTYVLEGEQFLEETLPDGTTRKFSRKKGEYAISRADALPHAEWGGEDGATVIFSMTARDGILFEYFDEEDEKMEKGWTLSIAEYVDAWNKGTPFGAAPGSS